MGDCSEKKNTCGSKVYATCVYYNGYLPLTSQFADCTCDLTVEEVIGELYGITEDIDRQIDLTGLVGNSIDYDEAKTGTILVKEALKKHAELLLELTTVLDEQKGNPNVDISNWGLDTKCLEDECDNGLLTLKDLVQALINKVCTCCT